MGLRRLSSFWDITEGCYLVFQKMPPLSNTCKLYPTTAGTSMSYWGLFKKNFLNFMIDFLGFPKFKSIRNFFEKYIIFILV